MRATPARVLRGLAGDLLSWLLTICVGAAVTASAHAAALAVAPVRIDLSSQVRTTRIDVQNHGDHVMFVQVDAQAWTHDERGDQFSPTDQLVFNPPLFRLAPGERQILRVGLRQSAGSTAEPVAGPANEQAYRLFLTEVSKAATGGDQITVNMRVGLPVFVRDARGGPVATMSPASEPAALAWRLTSDGGRWLLTLANGGAQHVKVGDLVLEDGRGERLRLKQGAYCLAGSVRRWRLPSGDWTGALTLKTEVDGRPHSASLRLANP